MNLDKAIYYADDPQGRADFRQHLVNSILESKELRKHPTELQEKFLFMLSNSWRTKNLTAERDRRRSIEKVRTDANRLLNAIRALQEKDQIALDYAHNDAPLSKLMLALTKLKEKSEALANAIEGEHEEIRKIQDDLNAVGIVNTLQMFGIPCSSRNDHPNKKEVPPESDTQKNTKKRLLPPVHKYTSISMRCVMLALLDADEEKLSWTTTNTIIKRGKALQKKANAKKLSGDTEYLLTVETKASELYFLDDPLGKHIKIEKND